MNKETKTPLYEIHKKLNANIVNYYNFLMPIFYTSIQEEHNAVRNNVGIFDVSHMGNFLFNFKSKDAAVSFFNYLLANDFTNIKEGKCIYSTMLNHNGNVIDDLIVMSITNTKYHVIVNSANIKKDYEWIKNVINDIDDVEFKNASSEYSIIAVQGPKSAGLLKKEFNLDINSLKFFEVKTFDYNNHNIIISRTGYTGEDGFEIFLNNNDSKLIFSKFSNYNEEYKLKYCGLGARDTLRLEAGLPLYGHEYDDKHSPLQSNFSWSVKLNKELDFIGKKALLKYMDNYNEKIVGFEVLGRAIPRTGMEIVNSSDETIGHVTSGSFSPTLQKNIGLAYLNINYINDHDIKIKIRNRILNINIINLPFYKRKK